jgi:hypothetical protein
MDLIRKFLSLAWMGVFIRACRSVTEIKKFFPSEYIGRFSQLLDLELSSLESDS